LFEPHALLRKGIQIGRLDDRMPETAEIAVTEVIREEEDEVRLRRK
jgi:hypothetical protein